MMGSVLSLCDFSGVAVRPWLEGGYDCLCVDTQHYGGITLSCERLWLLGRDVRSFDLSALEAFSAPSFIAAFPPCTHLAVSGARWFKGKGLRKLAEAIELVAACADICEATGAPYFIENPVSTLSTYWREPDYTFDPCDYAGYLDDPSPEAYTKKTCLWTGGGFVMPEPKPVIAVLGSKMHTVPPGPERENIRSRTPAGFAMAVYLANRENA